MSARKPSKDEIHAEILRDLERNPPRAAGVRETPKPAAPPVEPPPAKSEPAPRPALMLRRLRLELALERLATFVRFHAAQGTPEILVIVGKGRNSPGGKAVVGPAVREWCARQPRLVRGVREATRHEGGEGALVLELRR